jgi:hypothetical protein
LVETADGSVRAKDQRDTSYQVIYTPKVSLENIGESGLRASVWAEYYNRYDTEVRIRDGVVSKEYVPSRETLTYLTVGYKLNDRLSFNNDFVIANQDLYGKPGYSEGNKYENRAKLSWTMY